MKRNFIAGFLSGAIMFGAVGVVASQIIATPNPFPITLNGEKTEIEGYNINDNTYFKLRDIADAVGGFTVDFVDGTIVLENTEEQTNVGFDTAFDILFESQADVLEENLYELIIATDGTDEAVAEATMQSADTLITKAYDIANLYLTEYDPAYAMDKETIAGFANELKAAMQEGKEAVTELENANDYWDAGRAILKQFYFELYQYSGEVDVTLTVG